MVSLFAAQARAGPRRASARGGVRHRAVFAWSAMIGWAHAN